MTDATGPDDGDDGTAESDIQNGDGAVADIEMPDGDQATDGERSPSRRLSWRRVASVLGVLALVLVVLPFVVYLVPQVVGGTQSYVVLSGSMQPAIGPGDMIVVGNVDPAAIETGDVITFSRSGEARPTTHRVVETLRQDGEPAFRTAGDNNDAADRELVRPAQIEGRVLTVGGHHLAIPFVGRVILFASTQTGFFLLGILPFSLFVVNEVWRIVSSTHASPEETTVTEATAANGEDVDPERSTDHEATAAQGGTAPSDDSPVSFTAGELELGLAIAVAFLAYSVWVAYTTVETWAMGVAGAVTAMVLLLAGLFFFGGASEPPDPDGTDTLDPTVEDPPSHSTGDGGTGRPERSPDGDDSGPDGQLTGNPSRSSPLEAGWADPDWGGQDPPDALREAGDQTASDGDSDD